MCLYFSILWLPKVFTGIFSFISSLPPTNVFLQYMLVLSWAPLIWSLNASQEYHPRDWSYIVLNTVLFLYLPYSLRILFSTAWDANTLRRGIPPVDIYAYISWEKNYRSKIYLSMLIQSLRFLSRWRTQKDKKSCIFWYIPIYFDYKKVSLIISSENLGQLLEICPWDAHINTTID